MNKKKTKMSIVLILLTIFIIIFINIINGNIQKLDNAIFNLILKIRNPILTNILTVITNIGGLVSVGFITLILTIIMFVLNKRKYGVAITLNVLFSSVAYIILKNIFQRPRPPVEERLVEETGYSFPSGHATNNMAFYGFLIYLIYKNIKNKVSKSVLITALSLLMLLIGFSRIYLRVHYPSDVIAGFCLGVICVIIFVSTILNRIKEKEKIES